MRKIISEHDKKFDEAYAILCRLTSRVASDLLPQYDHIFIMDRLLEQMFLNQTSVEEYFASIDTVRTNHINKLDLDFDLIGFFENMIDSIKDSLPQEYDALTFIYKKSIKLGIYASHIKTFTEKDYPLNDFDASNLQDILEPEFPRLKDNFLSNVPYISILSLSDFLLAYEPKNASTIKELFLSTHLACLLEVGHAEFDLKRCLDEIKCYVSQLIINKKIESGMEITDFEKKIFKENNPIIARANFNPNSARTRLIGLKMWDLVNISSNTRKNAFKTLLEEGQLYGATKQCASLSKGEYTCSACINSFRDISMINCFRYFCEQCDLAETCIRAERVSSKK